MWSGCARRWSLGEETRRECADRSLLEETAEMCRLDAKKVVEKGYRSTSTTNNVARVEPAARSRKELDRTIGVQREHLGLRSR